MTLRVKFIFQVGMGMTTLLTLTAMFSSVSLFLSHKISLSMRSPKKNLIPSISCKPKRWIPHARKQNHTSVNKVLHWFLTFLSPNILPTSHNHIKCILNIWMLTLFSLHCWHIFLLKFFPLIAKISFHLMPRCEKMFQIMQAHFFWRLFSLHCRHFFLLTFFPLIA